MTPLRAALAALLLAAPAAIAAPAPKDWPAILEAARGQTVWFNAWGGSTRINDYIAWAAAEAEARFGFEVEQVKLGDTSEAVSRVVTEITAGLTEGGAVDLIWINGENFAAMKSRGLLYGPWAGGIPNAALLDPDANPALSLDFAVETEGYESPWGLAQFVFYRNAARLPEPPMSIPALLDWAKAHPGRFAFPAPPDFLGVTFLKQALIELTPDRARLIEPPGADAETILAPLWAYMRELTPHLWRGGRAYPASGPRLFPLMADDEIDLAVNFGAGEISAAVANYDLPETARAYVLTGGTIANAHFLAIPANAKAKEAAMVFADFLLSPEAQARKADPEVWGDATALSMEKLPPEEATRFAALDPGPAAREAKGPALPEPHADWAPLIEAGWKTRFAVAE